MSWRRHRRRGLRRFALLAAAVSALAVLALLVVLVLGLAPHLSDLYFAATLAVLPGEWHDTWRDLPGVVHVALAVVAVAALAGAAGELFD